MSEFILNWFDGKYVIFCKELDGALKYDFLNGSLEHVETGECLFAVSGRYGFVRKQGIKHLMPRRRKLNGGGWSATFDLKPFIIPDGTKIGGEIDSTQLRFKIKIKVKNSNNGGTEFKRVPIYCYDPRVLAMSSACSDIHGCKPSTLERLGTGETEWDKKYNILKRLNPSKEAAIEYLEKNRYTYKRPLTMEEVRGIKSRDPGWTEQILRTGDISPLLEELERQESQAK